MATIIREALNADQMSLTLWTGGMSKVGISLSGTWAGTVSFLAANDALNFFPVTMTPFASGTGVQSATATGNWERAVENLLAFRALFTRTSGTAIVTMAASLDASYQDAFLASTSKYVTQSVGSGAQNKITVAAQANRAWRLKSLSVGFSVAAGAAVDLQVSDGASSLLWEGYVPLSAGAPSAGGTWLVPIPLGGNNIAGIIDGGLVTTPGNSLVITLAAPGGSVVSTLNAELVAA
jgi:hypothetical protein